MFLRTTGVFLWSQLGPVQPNLHWPQSYPAKLPTTQKANHVNDVPRSTWAITESSCLSAALWEILIKVHTTHQYTCKSGWRICSATSLCRQHFSACRVLPRVCCRLEQQSSSLSPTESRTHCQDQSPEQGSTAWTGSPPRCNTLEETEPLQYQAREVNKEGQDPVRSSYFTCLFPPVSGNKSVCRSTFSCNAVN